MDGRAMRFPWMRFTIRRMIGIIVCLGIFVDPEMGYGTIYPKRYSESGFNSLVVGMTQDEVEAIMGPPLEKKAWLGAAYPVAGGEENWIYSEPSNDGDYWRRWVIFRDGKVLAIVKIWYLD
jgi:hypothetical protein